MCTLSQKSGQPLVSRVQTDSSGTIFLVTTPNVLPYLNFSPAVEESMEHVWEIFGYVFNTLVFLFSGILVVYGMKLDGYIHGTDAGWILLLYVVIHVTRAITV